MLTVYSRCVFLGIPSRLFYTLYLASEAVQNDKMRKKTNSIDEGNKMKEKVTVLRVKKWLLMLVRRSLVLEIVKSTIALHDVRP